MEGANFVDLHLGHYFEIHIKFFILLLSLALFSTNPLIKRDLTNNFESGSIQLKDHFILSLSTDQICDLSLVSSSSFDLVTLGG